ncbi:MAG: M3 family metallopeptidase [Acidobacteriota bacterium]|nr:M3 family metallopeptidase [Acidobacteriota bacterium]
MKKALVLAAALAVLIPACKLKETQAPVPTPDVNPFFTEWTAPFGTPPFDQFKPAHYMPAYEKGMADQKAEIAAVAVSTEAPTFANTVEALERSGRLLSKVNNVFGMYTNNHTSDELQEIEQDVAPLLSKHSDDIVLDAKLFARLKAVFDQRASLSLTPEQSRLLEKTYKDFVRSGAALDEAKKAELRAINEELTVLEVKFGQNVLKEDNGFTLVIDKAEDLAGLPEDMKTGAAEAAKAKGLEGKWVFSLHKPSCIPFFQYSAKRELREKLFKAFIARGDNGNEADNKAIVSKIASLRVKRAALLGYKTHADYVLEETMAKTPAGVYKLLDQIWKPALAMAKVEAKELEALMAKDGIAGPLQAWDWWYYADKLKKAKYDLDDEALRPYFELKAVRQGAFDTATKLWGLTFTPRTDIPVYHPDVEVFEVKEADGTHVGILYSDYFPRPSKRGGAWSSAIRSQSAQDGKKVTPIVYNVGNFTKPTAEKPSLITFEEATTLFHEFGHALHDLLSNVTYESLGGTNVPRDFVELPSQIMENWASDSEVIKTYAKHYKTGQPIPQDLVDKIKKSGQFNQGFTTIEYTSACYLDMAWHILTTPEEKDVRAFENAAMKTIGLIPQVVVRYKSPYFTHIFTNGYSAGYYSYIWSEVLDKDAFEAFKEKGLFDPATAKSYRDNILSKGNTREPMDLYKAFRGREPKVEPLLKARGLLK